MGVVKYTKEELTDLYWGQSLSISEIATQMHTSLKAIHRAMVRCGVPRRNLSQATRMATLAERNSRWKGVNIDAASGRARAQRMYPKQLCCVCSSLGERHHKDGNPLNNEVNNIDWLCRKHHMKVDGRLVRRTITGQFRGRR